MFFVLVLEEEFLFRRPYGNLGTSWWKSAGWYDWEVWGEQKKLPVGLAAFAAFCIGWVGAVSLCSVSIFDLICVNC